VGRESAWAYLGMTDGNPVGPSTLTDATTALTPPACCLDVGVGRSHYAASDTMRAKLILPLGLALAGWGLAAAQTFEQKPQDAGFERFVLLKAPKAPRLVLKAGDRLAICGDSITEQKMYSRMMEDYLTVCAPDLKVTVRQYGWSGERAPGFLARMTNDCLLFKPTVATT